MDTYITQKVLGWDWDADLLPVDMCHAIQGRGSSMKTRGTLSRGLQSYRRKPGQGQVDDTTDAIASVTMCW